jgi:hypothetical protein
MTGFDKDAVRLNLEMTSELVPVVVVAIGTQDAPEKLAGPAAEREVAPRSRKPLDELVIAGLPAK